MSSAEFGWESLLQSDAPRECKLQRALFTTYDRAEECLLVEDLLPELLRLDPDRKSEGVERKYFMIELYERLKQLHDRLVVVSSMTREEGEADKSESGTYGWIWRSIRHLKVGNRGMAVQHAKLWMLHWGADEDGNEYLEVVVSSANLTRSAFKAQLQGAWRVCLKLEPQSSEAKRRRWGGCCPNSCANLPCQPVRMGLSIPSWSYSAVHIVREELPSSPASPERILVKSCAARLGALPAFGRLRLRGEVRSA